MGNKRGSVLFLCLITAALTIGCTLFESGPRGTYSDASGAFVLVLKSGSDATFTFAGETAMCTYKTDGPKLTLSCKGSDGPMVMTIQSDGSLTGPPGTFMPPLRKK